MFVCFGGSVTTIVAMTLLIPYLPIYIRELGVTDPRAVAQWSGVTFGATFLMAALTAPLWGALGDRYGRKSMLIRASAGMTVAMSLTGLVQNVWQLLALRLLVGLLGGYTSGSTVLVATQTPKNRSAWALGVLSSGIMAGSVIGPLLGGIAPDLIGIRATFFLSGATIFCAFLATTFLIKERRPARAPAAEPGQPKRRTAWSGVTHPWRLAALLTTAMLLMFATMSVEPIITVYVTQLAPGTTAVATIAGVVMAAGALGTIVSAPRLGKLADRIGHPPVICGCLLVAAALLTLQAAAQNNLQLGLLRFLMGLSLGGLLPAITASIRHNVGADGAGQILGYSISAQYVGQVAGPTTGGFVGGHFGMPAVFLSTSFLLVVGAALTWWTRGRVPSAERAG
ncbi:multidrug efflux MFS transporter [Pseudonocardia eucalypti]|uniref:Multidrug efflux MFS transporter n=1 Tax=Pseudonocardia eucalypti TaxID=648755 RepID=A0ABP9QD76_9PSEU